MNMSRFLKNNNISIDHFISSPAVRALNTCKIFNQTYQLNCSTDQKLYNPSERSFESVIYDLDDNLDSVAFFSHNNGISNFANSISEDIFHFPTCGVAGFEVDCNSWSEFDGARKNFCSFMSLGKYNLIPTLLYAIVFIFFFHVRKRRRAILKR